MSSQTPDTLAGLNQLRRAMLAAGHVNALHLEGLQEERVPVFAGGVAVLLGAFEALLIRHMPWARSSCSF